MKKIYIDGQAGTTGLQIHERLKDRDDLVLLEIDPTKRKDEKVRQSFMQEADLVFLCLPDQAAQEAARWLMNMDTKVIDASTAHRTNPNWVYGFAELNPNQKEAIKKAKYVANPGCHASGFIALVSPLIQAGLLSKDAKLSAFSLTGYSGGGKAMIAQYENEKTKEMESPKPYALGLSHKHLPEMQAVCELSKAPIFVPIVDDFKQGMLVQVLLDPDTLASQVSVEDLMTLYQKHYENTNIQVLEKEPALFSNSLEGSDRMEIFVNGNENGLVLSARFDNLGKGASGAAVQNMNLMLGLEETKGLHLNSAQNL